jgi:hypothetical protein
LELDIAFEEEWRLDKHTSTPLSASGVTGRVIPQET